MERTESVNQNGYLGTRIVEGREKRPPWGEVRPYGIVGHFASDFTVRAECASSVEGVLFLPSEPEADRLEKKFVRLRDEWKRTRGHESSPQRMAMNPAYLKIIGMGQDAIPFILRELSEKPDMWFVALWSITEANPVPADVSGNLAAMAQAWIQWGRDSGFQR
jgi:hypothetical protein